MKKTLISVIVIPLVVLAVTLIGVLARKTTRQPVKSPVAEAPHQGRACYAYRQLATPDAPYAVDETVDLTVTGTDVAGSKRGTQNGPDMTNGYEGSLEGTLTGETMRLTFSYTIEGSEGREVELYTYYPEGIYKLRYPLKDQGDQLVPDETKPYRSMLYKQVECPQD